MDTTLFLVLLAIVSLIIVAFVMWRRWRSRRALMLQVRELQALAETGRALAEAQLDSDELCELIYRHASEMMDTSTFQLGLFDGPRYNIRLWVRDGQHVPSQSFDLSDNPGLVGWVRQARQPLVVHDFEQERDRLPAQPRYSSDAPPRSAIFMPLVARDQAIGALAIQSFQPKAFTDNHLRLLSIIANQAAAAISNARLLEQERRRAAHLQLIGEIGQQIAAILDLDTLFHQTVELVRATFGYMFVAICVREENSNRIIFEGATHPAMHNQHVHVGQGIIGWVVENGEMLNVPDVTRDERYWPVASLPQTHSELAVPLIFGEEVIGVIDVESDQPAAFDDEDIYTLRTLAGQIAIAIHEARLYAAEREQAWISTALLQVAEATGHATSLEEVLDTVVRITPLLSGVERCGVMLLDGEPGHFRTQAAFGVEALDDFYRLRLKPGDSLLLDQIFQTYKPLVRPSDGAQDVLFKFLGPGDVLGLPLLAHGELNGVMWIGATPDQILSQRKAALLGGIANQAAMAIESAQLAIAQREEAWVNLALLQVSEAIGPLTDLDEISSVIVRLAALFVGVDLCAIFLADKERALLIGRQVYGLPADQLNDFMALRCAQQEWLVVDDDPARSVLAVPDRVVQALRLQTPVVVPLRGRTELVGALLVDGRTAELLRSQRRLNILNGIASQASTSIESVQLLADLAMRQVLEHELDLAREIQKSFLPECCPEVPGYELAAAWRSARRVGGDFYDFMLLANGNVGIAIADVADKGVPAALFMALSRTLVRATSMSGRTPSDALRRTNTLIISDARSDLFVTVFYGVLHPRSGSFTYANAGHNPPLWLNVRSGTVQRLHQHGMALGVIPDTPLSEHSIQIEPGDVLALYTDGVTEALNVEGEEFGVERLEAVVQAHAAGSAEEVVAAIEAAVDEFVGNEPPFDDFTLVVLKRVKDKG
ncbi:Phosphoserine phosphatase RsbU [Thermoflexales bacterium]|nr:Phosphoserine phosphatase RsbU [Thermoflexales bacterium]